jgi:DNA-binding transcriptional regulator YdaS (Cro superfamily)
MSPAEIITALGGKHALAALTGASPNAVTQWRRIGVPAKYWDVLVDHAAAKGVAGITFPALRATKPAPGRAAPGYLQQEAA